MQRLGVILIVLLAIAVAGIANADQGVPAVPETQGLVTGTSAQVAGFVTETDAGAWTLTNDPEAFIVLTNTSARDIHIMGAVLQELVSNGGSYTKDGDSFMSFTFPQSLLNQPIEGPGIPSYLTWGFLAAELEALGYTKTTISGGIHTGALDPGQVQYTTAYDATILAQSGTTSFVKSMNLNTGNKVVSQSNIDAKTVLSFIATGDGGNVVGSENLLLDGAAMATSASDRMLCPFASVNNSIIPAYCNIVQTGSAFDLTVGSVTTGANNRFVGTDATIPVVQNYNINVKPYNTAAGQIPATGAVTAYIKTHMQEARGQDATNYSTTTGGEEVITMSWMVYSPPAKAEDLMYSETTSASGIISTFSKSMSYQSQARSTLLNSTNVYIPPID